MTLSIKRVIFTSGHFSAIIFTLEITFRSLLLPKNPNLKKIPDLKVYSNPTAANEQREFESYG